MSKQQSSTDDPSPHPAFRLRHTLKGHKDDVYRMALSPDGRILASPSADETVRLWDIENGKLLRILKGHNRTVVCVAWSLDGQTLASGSTDDTVRLWNAETGEMLQILRGHAGWVMNIDWSLDGQSLASGSINKIIHLWNIETGQVSQILRGHLTDVVDVAWSSDGKRICSGSWDKTVRLWDTKTGKELRVLEGHTERVKSVAWSPNGQSIASGGEDKIVRIWDPETGQQTDILEAHTAIGASVAFFNNGHLLGSFSEKGTVIIWQTDTWTEVAYVSKIGEAHNLSNLAFHPTLRVIATPGESRGEINIWDLNFDVLLITAFSVPTIHYVNAKTVLVGNSGVGKSGLGIRIAEKEFRATDSTHGAQFWQIPVPEGTVKDEKLPNVQAELTLWDLAGQPEYRLVHQLFLDDTDVALLLFDCSDPNDPFRGVPYWAKVLKKHAPEHALKFTCSERQTPIYSCSLRKQISPVFQSNVESRDVNWGFALPDHV